MYALIFDIRRYTIHDGPGIRTTVFFKGCPMRCRWCHNPESQETGVECVTVKRKMDGRDYKSELAVGSWQSAEEIMKEIEKDSVFYRKSGGGVTFSGGEPLMQADALQEILLLCKERGFHTAVDTSGYAEPAAFNKIRELPDLWLYDLKLTDDLKHVEFTGVSNEFSLKNLEIIAKAGKEIIIRFPLIPGITDEIENLHGISTMMKQLNLQRIDVLPYHAIAHEKYRRMGKMNYLEGVKEPEQSRVDEIIE
jgi:pyruvate formate lyase activating enzyme